MTTTPSATPSPATGRPRALLRPVVAVAAIAGGLLAVSHPVAATLVWVVAFAVLIAWRRR